MAQTLVSLVFGVHAGALVDQWDRKRTMIWCDVARAVLTAIVPVAYFGDFLTMPLLYVMAIGNGILYSAGRAVPFGLNAVTFLASAVSLRFIRSRFQEPEARSQGAKTPEETLADVREGRHPHPGGHRVHRGRCRGAAGQRARAPDGRPSSSPAGSSCPR